MSFFFVSVPWAILLLIQIPIYGPDIIGFAWGRTLVADTILRFWFRYVEPNRSSIEKAPDIIDDETWRLFDIK